jgi:hypothetical protein
VVIYRMAGDAAGACFASRLHGRRRHGHSRGRRGLRLSPAPGFRSSPTAWAPKMALDVGIPKITASGAYVKAMLFAQVSRLRACGPGSAEGRIQQQPTSRNWSSEATHGTGFPGGFPTSARHDGVRCFGGHDPVRAVKGDKNGAVQ